MKTYMLPIAIVTLAVSAMAGAQTPPTSPTSPGDTSSSSSTQAPSSTGSSSYSNGMSDSKMQMKDCVAKQKASNSQLSDADAKRACAKSDSSK